MIPFPIPSPLGGLDGCCVWRKGDVRGNQDEEREREL